MMNGPRTIALTGGIASGKSLVADYLKNKGVPVVDADDVVHQLLQHDPEIQQAIRELFGESAFDQNGSVDRKALGALVFNDSVKRKQLEGWIHPRVRQAIEAFIQANAEATMVVAVIPLLFESGLEGRYSEVWLVDVPASVQIARLMQNRKLSEGEATARLKSQMSREERVIRLKSLENGTIIPNYGSPTEVYFQTAQLLNKRLAFNS